MKNASLFLCVLVCVRERDRDQLPEVSASRGNSHCLLIGHSNILMASMTSFCSWMLVIPFYS